MTARSGTLTQLDLNRALRVHQVLLEGGRASLPQALDRVGGLQVQHAPSRHIGPWSRLEDFERDALRRALERRDRLAAFHA